GSAGGNDRSLECSIAVAQQNVDVSAIMTGAETAGIAEALHDVEVAVAVDVRQHQGYGAIADHVSVSDREPAIPFAQQHRGRVLIGIGGDQIGRDTSELQSLTNL